MQETGFTQRASLQSLEEAVKRIAESLRPDKIYLFGSHAWGVATPDSDIDLFVVVKSSTEPPHRRSREAYRALRGIRMPIEVIVRTAAEVEHSCTVASSLAYKVLQQGKLLYG